MKLWSEWNFELRIRSVLSICFYPFIWLILLNTNKRISFIIISSFLYECSFYIQNHVSIYPLSIMYLKNNTLIYFNLHYTIPR